MEWWLPNEVYQPATFRRISRIRRAFDAGFFSRSWRFGVDGAYIPRDAIRESEQLRVRFAVSNLSRHEGTIYYIVRLRDVYDGRPLYSSDASLRRHGHTVCIPAGERHRIEHTIDWDDLVESLGPADRDEVFLAVEIEIWTPLRLRATPEGSAGSGLHWSSRDLFQHVELMHNPSLVLRPAVASGFISYAWQGHPDYPEHSYRYWVYRLADALSRSGIRPLVDYNFLAPAAVTREVIERALAASDAIILVYSDGYVERIGNSRTGVGFEYGLIRSQSELWAKTVPIRRGLKEREAEAFSLEARFVADFEGESLGAQAVALAQHILSPLRTR